MPKRPTLIYLATNLVNGKRYIGVTGYLLCQRKGSHIKEALTGAGKCRKFHAAIKKYGPEEFYWAVIAKAPDFEAGLREEARLIAEMKPEYNITPGGRGSSGVKRTPEQLARMRAVSLGRKWSAEQHAKFKASMTGRRLSDETKKLIGAANKGQKRTPEQIAVLSAAHLGNGHTEETRAKMSKTRMGRPRPQWVTDKIVATRRMNTEARNAL